MRHTLYIFLALAFVINISAQEPLWDLAEDKILPNLKQGKIEQINGKVLVGKDRCFAIPASAFPDQKNFTLKIGIRFKDISNGAETHLLRKMKNAQDNTGLGFSFMQLKNGWKATRAIVNGMHIGEVGFQFRDGMSCTFTVHVKNGIPAYYKDDRLINRFFITVIPNNEPMWVFRRLYPAEFPMNEIEITELKVYGADYKYISKDDPSLQFKGLLSGSGWDIEAPYITDKNRPKLLIYGDSIAFGYKKPLLKKLGEKIYTFHWGHFAYDAAKSGNDTTIFQLYRTAAASAQYDVIVFNNGLHSLHWTPDKVSDEQIYITYTQMLKGFQAGAPHAKIYYMLTTPHTERQTDKKIPVQKFGDKNPMVIRLNRIAEKVMKDNNIEIIDAYSPLAAHLQWAVGDQYHWNSEAREMLADMVMQKTFEALKNTKK